MDAVKSLDVTVNEGLLGNRPEPVCFVADKLYEHVSSGNKNDEQEVPKGREKKLKLNKREVEIASLRIQSEEGESWQANNLTAERGISVQFLEMEHKDVVMISVENGEKLVRIEGRIKDDKWRQILRVAHNKCLEKELDGKNTREKKMPSRTRKRTNRSKQDNAILLARNSVSKVYKDLSCEVIIRSDSSNKWNLCVKVSLMYVPQNLNRFSTETKIFLDTWFSRGIESSLDSLPPSPFIQGKFLSQTIAHTRQKLSEFSCEPVEDVPNLNLNLLPFQSCTVRWMLSKELGDFLPGGLGLKTESDLLKFLNECVSCGYEAISRNLFWNKFTNFILMRDEVEQIYSEMRNKGSELNQGTRGILCEEMGLGKTIEILSLILLNRRKSLDIPRTFIAKDGKTILRTFTTLIICPNAILQQWINEVNFHTDNISIFHYKGFVAVKKFFRTDNIWEIVKQLSHYDIIIISYNVLSTEVHYAEYNASSRPRRSTCPIKYDYSSPLSLMQFFRIILDEVQMLHSDSTKAAKCTSLLHRVHTWGVSGTPIQLIKDFQTVLSYLKISPFHELPEIVSSINNNVIQKDDRQMVKGIKFPFSQLLYILIERDLAVRHSREDVISQIHIPKQHNYIVPLEFAPVEWDNYLDAWNNFITVSGYGIHGMNTPRLNSLQLNQWLARLRYLCCHAVFPDSRGNSRGQFNLSSSLHNIDDILKLMIADAIEKLDSLYRDSYQLQIRSAQAKTELQDNPDGAIELLQHVREKLYEDLRIKCLLNDPLDTPKTSIQDVTGTARSGDSLEGVKSVRIRTYLDLLHQCFFFMATAYYNKGSSKLESVDEENEKLTLLKQTEEIPGAEPKNYNDIYNMEAMKDIEKNQRLEQEYYRYAEKLRKRILFSRVQKVEASIKETQKYFENVSSFRPQNLQLINFNGSNNFSNSMLVSRCFQILSLLIESLNGQALQFNELFEQLANLVYEPIIREYDESNEEEKAQEYSKSIENQDKMFAIFACMERLLENRDDVVTSDETIKLSKETFKPQIGQDFSDYHSELLSNLRLINGTPLKPIFDDLKNAKVVRNISKGNIKSGTDFEDFLLQYEEELPRMIRENKSIRESLKKLNVVYNVKLEYYSHLQRISDSLVPLLQLENVTRNAIVKSIRDGAQYNRILEKISSAESRVRYLNGLNKLKESIENNRSFSCAICFGTIHAGSIIKCGHFFCRKCIQSWLKNNHSCPLCKTRATLLEVYNFKFKDEPVGESSPSRSSSPEKKINSDKDNDDNDDNDDNKQPKKETLDTILKQKYELFPQFEEVHKMVIKESFGAKIDFVIKLILFLKLRSENESGRDESPQILMYSQSFEFLKVISRVLSIYEIKHISCWTNLTNVGEAISKFKRNPSITCLLLNVKTLGAGLNLLNARHIFLLDPIINHGDELQAMSRNNRIGQTNETYVWNFMIKNSVEQNIFKYKCVLEGRRKQLGERLNVKQENSDMITVLEEDEREEFEMNESTGEQVSGKHLRNCFFPCASQ